MGTGSRNYVNRNRLYQIMDTVVEASQLPITVIAGGAAGADALYKRWAAERRLPFLPFPADWKGLGRKAGPMRNQRMVEYGPDFYVAVGMEPKSGTEDCVRRAIMARIAGWVDGPGYMPETIRVNGALIRTHGIDGCVAPCAIHWPTGHRMVDYPQHWRDDRALMERICPHGIGHPDPDDLDYKRRTWGEGFVYFESIHGCDGCCGEEANR